jgi:ubiquinone/menaquinone biosynthesis C-methylase UbiE
MTSPCIDRFDRTAEGYLRWWAPVLEPGSDRLVERLCGVDPGLPGGESRDVLDLGCGTGNLLFAAAKRWPGATITGLDGSSGMLAVASRRADALPRDVRERISFVKADALALPLANSTLDLVATAYVLQMVPDRAPALAEIYRILKPGGIVAIVGWTAEKTPFAPEVELEEALAEAGIVRPPCREIRSGHFPSPRAAAAELRRVGFRRVAARADALDHRWTEEDFTAYRVTTRDMDLFGALDEVARNRALAALDRRVRALEPEQLVYRPPIVSVVGFKPR